MTLDRDILYLDVEYNGNRYDWQMYIPVGQNIDEFVASNTARIQAQIDAKEAQWAALTPKTRTIIGPAGQEITIDIQKEEIVNHL